MFRLAPLRRACALILALPLAAIAAAQSPNSFPDSLPSAPQPQHPLLLAQEILRIPAFAHALLQDGPGSKSADTSPVDQKPDQAPIVTMAPHPDDKSWWLSGQANIITQGDLPFHSPYQGTNSFIPRGEYKTSMVGTVYTAWRPDRSIRYATDFIFDLEAAEGRGLGEAYGLAGFTNLDVVRNPNLGRVPYPARYGIHQVIGLTSETTSQDPGTFAIAPSVPVRRLEFRIGKWARTISSIPMKSPPTRTCSS